MELEALIPSIISAVLAVVAVWKSRESREAKRQQHDAEIERRLIERQLEREDTLSNKLDEYSIDNIDLRTLVGDLRLRIEQLEAGQKRLMEENQDLKGQIDNLKQQRELLVKQNEHLKEQLDVVTTREQQLRNEMIELRKEWGQSNSQFPPPSGTRRSRPAVEVPYSKRDKS